MTWTNFMLILVLAYLAYYSLNVLYDLLVSRRLPAAESGQEVLFFEEHTAPELITYEAPPVTGSLPEAAVNLAGPAQGLSSGLLQATGGVGLLQLVNLAKDGLIEYTRAIPY